MRHLLGFFFAPSVLRILCQTSPNTRNAKICCACLPVPNMVQWKAETCFFLIPLIHSHINFQTFDLLFYSIIIITHPNISLLPSVSPLSCLFPGWVPSAVGTPSRAAEDSRNGLERWHSLAQATVVDKRVSRGVTRFNLFSPTQKIFFNRRPQRELTTTVFLKLSLHQPPVAPSSHHVPNVVYKWSPHIVVPQLYSLTKAPVPCHRAEFPSRLSCGVNIAAKHCGPHSSTPNDRSRVASLSCRSNRSL